MVEKKPNRKERRAAESKGEEPSISDARFLKLADKFIDVANKENQHINATDLHMIFLYAAARYNAHVAKNVLDLDEHEPYVTEMLKAYQEMLRNHLADPSV